MATKNTIRWKSATTDTGHYHNNIGQISKVSVITGCLLQFVEMRHIGFHPTCKFIASLDVLQLAKCEIDAFSCLEPAPYPSCHLQQGNR